MIVQIYEVRSAEDARALIEAGVDHIGVLVGKGAVANELPVSKARSIFRAVTHPACRLALFLSGDVGWIARAVGELEPDIMHLAAAPEIMLPSDVLPLRARAPSVRIMRSIAVVDEQSIGQARSYDGLADFLLLDSHKPGDNKLVQLGLRTTGRLAGASSSG